MLQVNKSYLQNHLKISVFLIFLIILAGTLSYHYVFDFSWLNAFYMTVITIGTVGFGEVEPLSDEGRMFTAFLILIGIFIFAYAFSILSAYLVSLNINLSFNKKKMESKIDLLNGHTIICGYGRNGKQAASKLKSFKKKLVIIEQKEEAIKDIQENDFLYIEGNATDDETLIKAGVHRALNLITCLPQDADNLFIVLTAKQLNNNITIVSRASEESSIKKLRIAGADNIIMPDKIGGDHMASLIVTPDLVEFLDNLSVSSNEQMNIQEILLKDLPDVKKLDEMKIKERTGCTVIGYKKQDGTYIINPDIQTPVDTEGRIIVLGNFDQINKLNSVFQIF
ncbi:MAG: potassium channel protein [Saprospiraceae bacterium]|jgi:voltage-gated potassium channel|nr:potassium channel protein [Saprospiraceae bacterium]MBP6446747.1 potassium channel protein [Saprospiraceae bacterium]